MMADTKTNANVTPDIFTVTGVPPLVVVAGAGAVVDDEVPSVVVVDVVDGSGRNGVTMGWLIGMEEELGGDVDMDVDVDSSACVCVVDPPACVSACVSVDVEAGASP
ncbi:uncharacterized protein Triagg1_5890 [Trichoderma aggressivum f. europaeum]|uniref:Uncharacterized protein n=1 Tax=Trichoderma aggressivum f. europaeum TaxID=173218 RepID=A0AAE1LY26_9HYPO|nr:hypothetical protein Triagg1_5890 [Trichoderma aggressivum f. europaeum]